MARYDSGATWDSGLHYDEPEPELSAVKPKHMKVKLGLKGLSETAQVVRVRGMVTAITGNSHFLAPNPVPNPTLVSVTGLANGADAAIAAYNTAVSIVATRLTEKREALRLLREAASGLGAYVQNVSNGEAAIIQSAGMDVASSGTAVGPLPAPTGLVSRTDGGEGRVLLGWDPIRGASSYEVQASPDPVTGSSWADRASVTASRVRLENLPSVTRCWFRVRAIGAAGPGDWSDPAVKTIP